MRNYTEDEIRHITHNRWTGIMTRETMEIELLHIDCSGMAVVYWDIDNLKEANDRNGKPVSSIKMRNGVRAGQVELSCHVFSGDEYMAIMPHEDAEKMANRVQHQLRAEGMSATFVILGYTDDIWVMIDENMDEVINTLKRSGRRGTITDTRSCYAA